jgi:flagellar assembly protein FliH
MAKVIKKGKEIPGFGQFRLHRFFPKWKPGDAYGFEDQDFPSKRREFKQEEIEQEIRQRLAKEEAKWQGMVLQARAKGVQEGITQGRELGRQEIEPAVDLLRQWTSVLEAEKAEFFRNLEESLLKLGVFITEKIISREIRQDVKIVQKMVSNALAKVSHGGKINIRVHPQDLEIVKSMSLNEILPQGTGGEIAIDADNQVDRGGCMIETPGGIIDSRIKTQLDEIFQEVFGNTSDNTETMDGNGVN